MKVLHVCQRDDPATGGAARVAVELVKHLSSFNVDTVCLFVYGAPGGLSCDIRDRSRYLGGNSNVFTVSAIFRFWRTLIREKPDIIHHHDGLTWTHAISLLWRHAIRIGHGHLTAPLPRAPWRHRFAGWLQRKAYDTMICVSTGVADSWAGRGFAHDRIVVVPNGVDGDVFTLPTLAERREARRRFAIPENAFTIGYVGRLHDEVKCCFEFVRVLAALPQTAWGIMAGAGPDEAGLRQLAVELGVTDRIRFAGLLNPPVPCYHASDVFLLTSRYEPFGLVVLEATACGIPVVGFETWGGADDLLRRVEAIVSKTREPLEVAEKVLEIHEGRQSEPAKVVELRQRVLDEFGWDTVAGKVAAFYHNLLRRALKKDVRSNLA
jgi:glycosyltransferase involved in cell wall biosynthesis